MDLVWLSVALVGLNIFQAWFWSRQNQRLIDKLMSKNYAEYVQTNTLAKAYPKSQEQKNLEVEPDAVLDELNGMLGTSL
jgi:hypothetical protein